MEGPLPSLEPIQSTGRIGDMGNAGVIGLMMGVNVLRSDCFSISDRKGDAGIPILLGLVTGVKALRSDRLSVSDRKDWDN